MCIPPSDTPVLPILEASTPRGGAVRDKLLQSTRRGRKCCVQMCLSEHTRPSAFTTSSQNDVRTSGTHYKGHRGSKSRVSRLKKRLALTGSHHKTLYKEKECIFDHNVRQRQKSELLLCHNEVFLQVWSAVSVLSNVVVFHPLVFFSSQKLNRLDKRKIRGKLLNVMNDGKPLPKSTIDILVT